MSVGALLIIKHLSYPILSYPGGYIQLQGVTEVTMGYRGLQGVTGGYRGIQGVTTDYNALQEITKG